MRIAFIPLDDRPCTRDFAGEVARIAGQDLVMPPAGLLGHFLAPGSPEDIADWLRAQGMNCDVVVASIDMLAYGGLIASRSPEVECGLARQRLGVLGQVKKRKPGLVILAFNVLMRISVTAADAESARHWQMVHDLSILEHKAAVGLCSSEELLEKDRLLSQIPKDVISRYRQARLRNHSVNLFCLDLVSDGVIDFLSFCQEDAHVFGPHRAEQDALKRRASELGLEERVTIYPGTDEAGMLLVARAINEQFRLVPRFGFRYVPVGGEKNVAVFEDRPVEENVRLQVGVAGGCLAAPGTPLHELDCFCLVNCPQEAGSSGPVSPVDASRSQPGTPSTTGSTDPHAARTFPSSAAGGHEAVESLAERAGDSELPAPLEESGNDRPQADAHDAFGHVRDAIMSGVPVGILDIQKPNGADCMFMSALLGNVDIAALTAYAAWNTAGNSIGTVVATLAIASAALKSGTLQTNIHALDALCQFLFERFVDDWLYQSVVRPQVVSYFGSLPGINLHNLEYPQHYQAVNNMVREKLGVLSHDFYGRFFAGRPVPLLSGATGDTSSYRETTRHGRWPEASLIKMKINLPWERTFEVQVRADW